MQGIAKLFWIGYAVALLALLLVVLLPLFIVYSAVIPGIVGIVLVAFIYSLGLYGFIANKPFISWTAWRIVFRVLVFSIGLGCIWFLGFGKIKGVENAIFCLCFVPLAYALRQYSACDNPVWNQEHKSEGVPNKRAKSGILMLTAKGTLVGVGYVLLYLMMFYPMLRWDYYVSQYLFEQLCNDETKIGLFVYEQVELDEKYYKRNPTRYEKGEWGVFTMKVKEDLYINRDVFEQDYELVRYLYERARDVGPITFRISKVVRKRDNKTLGMAVNGINSQGWANRTIHMGQYTTKSCPEGKDQDGRWNANKNHLDLVRSIFSIKEEGTL